MFLFILTGSGQISSSYRQKHVFTQPCTDTHLPVSTDESERNEGARARAHNHVEGVGGVKDVAVNLRPTQLLPQQLPRRGLLELEVRPPLTRLKDYSTMMVGDGKRSTGLGVNSRLFFVGSDSFVSTIVNNVIYTFCSIPIYPSRMGQTKQYLAKKQTKPSSEIYRLTLYLRWFSVYSRIFQLHAWPAEVVLSMRVARFMTSLRMQSSMIPLVPPPSKDRMLKVLGKVSGGP